MPPLRPLALALLALLHCAWGAGVFELQVLEFSNYRLESLAGRCCGPEGAARAAGGACEAPCRARFALCLKEYQAEAAPGACSFGRVASPVLGTDSFTLAEPFYTLALPFSFRWTRSFSLILQAWDAAAGEAVEADAAAVADEEARAGLLAEARWSGIVEPGAAWHVLRHGGPSAALAYRLRVLCAEHYYNSTCTSFCRPRDDSFGHHACSPEGAKLCLPGWRGDNCEQPVCKEGCHPIHGRCDRPGDCDCRPGWRGELCAQCQPYPGCKHGYCNGSSWDCTCDLNWGGILCDQDLNYCGTHEPCKNGGTCENTAPDQFLCRCGEGFGGADCARVENACALAPCLHGACALAPALPGGVSCACERGWGGARCDSDLDDCAAGPCRHGALCRDRLDGFDCDCAPGWTGPTCDEDVDECAALSAEGRRGPCVNAAGCSNSPGSYACACLAGWEGRDCSRNVDDCAGQCLHGATCIDLVDDFHCACAPGWEGRRCERDVDDCEAAPCQHGGDCVDLLDAYRCICPLGFSGADCELSPCSGRYCFSDDRDHCAGAPCSNGATCYTAQEDYYCHCAPSWTGKNCTQRALAHQVTVCASSPCKHNATCLSRPGEDFVCVCLEGWTGKTCDARASAGGDCATECLNGGACVGSAPGTAPGCACVGAWAGVSCGRCECVHGDCLAGAGGCRCAAGWAGARCEEPAPDAEAALECSPACRRGRCVPGAGSRSRCECPPGWAGAACSERPGLPGCSCPAPSACALVGSSSRCVCPPSSPRATTWCLEQIAGLVSEADAVADEGEHWEGEEEGAADGECGAEGAWWRGCNACRCLDGRASCTRLWCGLPDCRAPAAAPCAQDEVCVPTAGALCVRGPCAAGGECRRVAGRRVEAPPLPAPAYCWPGARPSASVGCARAELGLAPERVGRGAHVERACWALRRALASALLADAPPAPLTLLCDLAPGGDALDLALWAGDDSAPKEDSARVLAAAVRALGELAARRRLRAHALLGAARGLRVLARGEGGSGGATAQSERDRPAASLAWLAGGAALALAALAGAALALLLRRRRSVLARERHDEEKSNNLQNEENLRRYAGPPPPQAAPPPALYKAQNADARNDTPPRDKELTKRGLPHSHSMQSMQSLQARPASAHAPPERLTVLV